MQHATNGHFKQIVARENLLHVIFLLETAFAIRGSNASHVLKPNGVFYY